MVGSDFRSMKALFYPALSQRFRRVV